MGGINLSCAHFIEIDGTFEGLHGHNMLVSAEVEGAGGNGIVMDFAQLERLLEEIVSELDHRVLIPETNPSLNIERKQGSVLITASGRCYSIPAADAALLPIGNSSVEEIGRLLYRQLASRLPRGVRPRQITVEEAEGRLAIIDEPG